MCQEGWQGTGVLKLLRRNVMAFLMLGNHGRKDQVPWLGELRYRLLNVLFFSKPLCNGPQKYVWHADHRIDACL